MEKSVVVLFTFNFLDATLKMRPEISNRFLAAQTLNRQRLRPLVNFFDENTMV
jgi:hypothetical protein